MSGKFNNGSYVRRLLMNDDVKVLYNEDGEVYCICVNKKYSKDNAFRLAHIYLYFNNIWCLIPRYGAELGRLEININSPCDEPEDFCYGYSGKFATGVYTETMWILYPIQ